MSNLTQPATRMYIFALISSLEADIREYLYQLPHMVPFPQDVREIAERRFEDDRKIKAEEGKDLLEYMDFGDLSKLLFKLVPTGRPELDLYLKTIASRLSELILTRNRVCHSRPLEPEDSHKVVDFILEFTPDAPMPWKNTVTTYNNLRENPALAYETPIPDYWKLDNRSCIPNNLPLPDFDDTGFLGRKTELHDLKKLLLDEKAVINVIGEGGIGKSALALKCLYDLVDVPDIKQARYDAIIWVSMKSNALTANGIREIEDSIGTTLGLVQDIAEQLGARTDGSKLTPLAHLIDEIHEYMREFDILLAIDNLETLNSDDEMLRYLLSGVPRNSKVLLTSRIGLQELEYRFKLEGMDRLSCISLARSYAKTFNLKEFYQLKDELLSMYVGKLFYNPLLIKWFISSIASGAEPQDLLTKENVSFRNVIHFCFENLYSRIDDRQKYVLEVMACANKPVSIVELKYLLEDDYEQEEVQQSINILNHSSMIRRISSDKHGSFIYSLTNIATEYLKSHHPPRPEVFSIVHKKNRKLRHSFEQEQINREVNKYDMFAIHSSRKNQNEKICAVNLSRALKLFRPRQLVEAKRLIEETKQLMPSFSECYRISAMLAIEEEDFYTAYNELQMAVELNPNSVIARFTFAYFLQKHMEEYEEALDHIEVALKLDKNQPYHLLSLKAFCLGRIGRYEESTNTYEDLLRNKEGIYFKYRTQIRDQASENYKRWAEHVLNYDKISFYKYIGRSLEIIEEGINLKEMDDRLQDKFIRICGFILQRGPEPVPSSLIENILHILSLDLDWLSSTMEPLSLIKQCKHKFKNSSSITESCNYLETLIEKHTLKMQSLALSGENAKNAEILRGIVKAWYPEKSYGFIIDSQGNQHFFHSNYILGPFSGIPAGTHVSFTLGENHQGSCAMNVKVEKAAAASK